MTVEEPAVALIGPGAIGTTIAAALHEVGRTPLVCGRRAPCSCRCVLMAEILWCRGQS
jgi:glycerol-3-phosphate dehydrogenase